MDERSNEIIDTQCWKLKAHYTCYRMILPLSSNLGLTSLSYLHLKTLHSLSSIKSCSEMFPYYFSLYAFGVLFVVHGPIATYQHAHLFFLVPSFSKLSSQHLQVDFWRKISLLLFPSYNPSPKLEISNGSVLLLRYTYELRPRLASSSSLLPASPQKMILPFSKDFFIQYCSAFFQCPSHPLHLANLIHCEKPNRMPFLQCHSSQSSFHFAWSRLGDFISHYLPKSILFAPWFRSFIHFWA